MSSVAKKSVVGCRDSHTFPNGLYVDCYSEIGDDYCDDRDGIKTQDDMINLQNKWKYIFPEIAANADEVNAETLIKLRESHAMQDKFVGLALEDNVYSTYINLLMPRTLFLLDIISDQFGVPNGVVLLQMWNAGKFYERKDGTWLLRN